MSGFHFLTLTELSEQIRRRSISPIDVTRLCLDRINEYDNILSGYLTVIGDRALRQASLAEEEISNGHWRGPLHGVPVALKDLISTKGTVTTAGMSLYKDHVPAFDATVVERFRLQEILEESDRIVVLKDACRLRTIAKFAERPFTLEDCAAHTKSEVQLRKD